VDVHVRWLREKIEADANDVKRIVTVRGVGYRFDG
jgi:DNA-binding response OmpR family regulator